MVSEHKTRACKILRVTFTISKSRVLRAAKLRIVTSNLKLTLDWDDQLRDNGQDLRATLLEHVEDTLNGEETVGVVLFTDTLEEDREVMMVVKLFNVDLPVNFVLGSVFNSNRHVSSVVETAELTLGN